MNPMMMILMVVIGFGILMMLWAKFTGASGPIFSLFSGISLF